MKLTFASDSSLFVSWPDAVSIETSRAVLGLFELLKDELKGEQLEFHPAFCSLLIEFNLKKVAPRDIKAAVEAAARKAKPMAKTGAKVVVPVLYDGEDLEEVAAISGLSRKEIINRHSEVEYLCAFLGFAPGFPYLIGLPKELRCPRKTSPRTRVPAGSVAIAGELCGIYPEESPGGWQLLGRTNINLEINPGDRIRFEAKDQLDFKETPGVQARPIDRILRVERGAPLISVQGVAKAGGTHLGISPGGAADPNAFSAANHLVGNPKDAEVLEFVAMGPAEISIVHDTWLAVTGADCKPMLDQMPIAMGASIPVSAGQRLSVQASAANFRSYIAVNFGGNPGHKRLPPDIYRQDQTRLRVTRGPQWEWFAGGEKFFEQDWAVTPDVSRRGVRVEGGALEYGPEFKGREMISEGIANGAIQVPPSGQPVILFCEQRTTGGYPKIANVIAADLFKIGQLRPGQTVRFELVSLEDAWSI